MKTSNGNHPSKTTEDLHKLYFNELKDIYWAEKHIAKALPKMAKAAENEELKSAFENHLRQTEKHATRLEKVFAYSGHKTSAKKCEAMEGLLFEGGEVMEDFEAGPVRDAGLIIAAQKVEHYEIAAYGSLRSLARVLGYEKSVELLQDSLNEEAETDKTLTALSDAVNENAFSGLPTNGEMVHARTGE